ncbi:hypothetical protein TRFO_23293 [Tritrichomonas foetus]|uniref:Uncharacterized protein n=1 Tax=Tritrichomonas foetus TaxID=1144522 RepID=A0A1J4KFU1_9EUKA|nr:hypothetical protein TRFO_23293 [Tritrichomonas foetus]|eukprot:OHT08221.1 hypothetical protein TRFO_23293 [Tritrichomonas foetus]
MTSKMKGFFKKRASVQAIPASKGGYLDVSISENHPLLSALPKYPANSIASNIELLPLFTKLLNWLKFHPNTAKYITLFNYTKKLDPKYHEFRQYALKSQITEGFKFISQLEAMINERSEGNSILSDPPHMEISHLNEYHKYWQQAVQQDFIIQLLKFEICEFRNEILIQNKQLAAHLISLLASIDAVPLNFIPYIHFSNLDVPSEVIYARNERCMFLLEQTTKYSNSNMALFKKIDDIYQKYDDSKEIQNARFHTIVASYRLQYDLDCKCLNFAVDPSVFLDFLAHPKSIAYSDVQVYYNNPTPAAFNLLVERIVELFSIKSMEEMSIINSLCSMVFTQVSLPEIKTDGTGTADFDDLMLFGLELFACCDPVSSLKFISDNTDINKPLEYAVNRVIEATKLYTSQWEAFLQYIVDYTISEYLSPKLNSVRFMIMQGISINKNV